MPTPKKISEFKPIITNLAQTSHYQVIFGAMSNNLLSYLAQNGVSGRFIAEDAGLLCASASLPGSSLATADISGNYMGVSEKMAHTRIFTEIGLEFYVDANYTMMKFLESWMEYIASGSDDDGVDPYSRNYYYRMRYPEEYKCDTTKIIKFDRDYENSIEYTFIGMFPLNLSSVPVSYDSSDILKVNVSFSYERYIPQSIGSRSRTPARSTIKDKSKYQKPPKPTFGVDKTGLQRPPSILAKSKPEKDRKVEAGLPYVGRNVGPIERWRSIP